MKKTKILAGLLSAVTACGAVSVLPANAAFTEENFFVYTGTYGSEELPLLEYYYPSDDAGYYHRKCYFRGDLPEELSYGDVFTTEGEVVTSADDRGKVTYELDSKTKLVRSGNCTDLMEQKEFTVVDVKYDGRPIMPAFSIFTYILADADGKEYQYSVDRFGSDTVIDTADIEVRDTVIFDVYNDSLIIPAEIIKFKESELPGDANCDNTVDIADAVLIQQFLANPEKYPISAQGYINADIVGNDGVTGLDALEIQKIEAAAKSTP